MIKLILLTIFIPSMLFADELAELRKDYFASINNENAAEKFYNNLKKKSPTDPLVMAYYGSAQALRAKHAFNPYNKISYLKSGLKTLEAAVNKSPDNLEIRFLRFSLEHYIPAFLGYSKHLETDKKKIIYLIQLKKFDPKDKELLNNLLKFMKETKRCSAEEIAILDNIIANG